MLAVEISYAVIVVLLGSARASRDAAGNVSDFNYLLLSKFLIFPIGFSFHSITTAWPVWLTVKFQRAQLARQLVVETAGRMNLVELLALPQAFDSFLQFCNAEFNAEGLVRHSASSFVAAHATMVPLLIVILQTSGGASGVGRQRSSNAVSGCTADLQRLFVTRFAL